MSVKCCHGPAILGLLCVLYVFSGFVLSLALFKCFLYCFPVVLISLLSPISLSLLPVFFSFSSPSALSLFLVFFHSLVFLRFTPLAPHPLVSFGCIWVCVLPAVFVSSSCVIHLCYSFKTVPVSHSFSLWYVSGFVFTWFIPCVFPDLNLLLVILLGFLVFGLFPFC